MSEKKEIDYPDLTWLGTIIGPHGLQGELKVYPLTDDPDFYCNSLKSFLKENAQGFDTINIKSLKNHKGIWILKCKECGDRNLAESWKRSRLLVNDKDLRPLDDDEVFLHQIRGAIQIAKRQRETNSGSIDSPPVIGMGSGGDYSRITGEIGDSTGDCK